jgi:iron complex transport system substrate-binding protein
MQRIKFKLTLALALCVVCLLSLPACRKSTGESKATGVEVTDAEGKSVRVSDSSRIVAVGTAVTETIYALGAGARLVGVDNSSSEYIKESATLPKVGPRTTLSAEGILSLKPTLVIMNADSGPPQIIGQLQNSGVTTLTLPANYTVETVKAKVRTISRALGLDAKGEELANSIDRDMMEVTKLLVGAQAKPKVMFVGRGPNMPNATMSGAGTTIDEMIRLAGGSNPMSDFNGFKEMTDEAVVAAQPDIILMTEKSFERSGGVDGVVKFPGVALTPAGKNRRIVAVSDMYFQGFGPGVGRAVRELAIKFHPELNNSESSREVPGERK